MPCRGAGKPTSYRREIRAKPSEVAAQISQREQDERWMRHAMALAARAEGIGEIPVGAVLVLGDKMGRGVESLHQRARRLRPCRGDGASGSGQAA